MKKRMLLSLVVLALVVSMLPGFNVYGFNDGTPSEPEQSEEIPKDGLPEVDVAMSMEQTIGTGSVPGTIRVTKLWEGNDNESGVRPDSVWVQLKANGVNLGDPVEITAASGWVYEYEGINTVDSNGIPYEFTIVEEGVVPNYLTTTVVEPEFVINNPVLQRITPNRELLISVDMNLLIAKKGNTFVVWTAEPLTQAEQYHIRTIMTGLAGGYKMQNPVSFIYGEGSTSSEIGMTVTSTWVQFQHPKEWSFFYAGTYGSASGITGTATGKILNVHKSVDRTNRTGYKVWHDSGNQDGMRPEDITIILLQDGVEYGRQVFTGVGDIWENTWTDLPLVDPATGELYHYTMVEDGLPEGYVPSLSPDGMTLTNTRLPETKALIVQKVWDDSENQDGVRPDNVQVQLKAGGEVIGEPVTLGAGEDWSYSWDNLPVYANGAEIVYNVEEITELTEYKEPTYEKETVVNPQEPDKMMEKITVTNGRDVDTTERTAKKIWNDKDDKHKERPKTIPVQLLADGKPVGEEVVLRATDDWNYTWVNLPKYAMGKEITYTVEETAVPENYEASYRDDGMTVINTHKNQKPSGEVTSPDPINPIASITRGTDKSVPKTGDYSNMALMMLFMITAGAGVILARNRKQKDGGRL